jgi:hypothetical protein
LFDLDLFILGGIENLGLHDCLLKGEKGHGFLSLRSNRKDVVVFGESGGVVLFLKPVRVGDLGMERRTFGEEQGGVGLVGSERGGFP